MGRKAANERPLPEENSMLDPASTVALTTSSLTILNVVSGTLPAGPTLLVAGFGMLLWLVTADLQHRA
jgi:hypothetical protein